MPSPSDLLPRRSALGPLVAAMLAFAASHQAPAQCLTPTSIGALIASDPDQADNFGGAVAVSQQRFVVGARGDDAAGTDAGAAYVFTRSGNFLTQQQKLIGSDTVTGDGFGTSVAIFRDVILVGAPGHSPATQAIDAGAVYVFRQSGGVWSQTNKLTASDRASGDAFGSCLAMNLYEGGSLLAVVIGAPYEDNTGVGGTSGGADAGAAYVFTHNIQVSGSPWIAAEKLIASDGAPDDRFGRAVALEGSTVVVGAPFNDPLGRANAGAGYVFTGNASGNTWSQQAKLITDAPVQGDVFGSMVACDDNTTVLTAPNFGGMSGYGYAYVFTRSGSIWSQLQRLTQEEFGDLYGTSVALSGDTLLVGRPGRGPHPTLSPGRVSLYRRNAGVWTYDLHFPNAGQSLDDRVGSAVAIAGGTLVVGAEDDDIGPSQNAGSATVFDLTTVAPIAFAQGPAPAIACPGGTAAFTVAATGGGTITYGWERESAPNTWVTLSDGATAGLGTVSGAATSTLTLTNLHPAATTRLRATATNACGGQTSGPAALTICPADYNCSGTVSVQDIFDFLAGYFNADPRADINSVGGITVQDIFDFLSAYFAGCP